MGSLANTFIPIVLWVYLTSCDHWYVFFTFETKRSDQKAIWSMGEFPRFGEGDSEENLFCEAQFENMSQMPALLHTDLVLP